MPIKFKCQCGKAFQVQDEMAGKRAKCPNCQQILTIPTPSQGEAPETSGAAPEAACPNCGGAMASDAVICMACGYNIQTGAVLGTEADVGAPSVKRKPTSEFPAKKIAILAVIVAVLGGGWLFVGAPLVTKLKIDNAYYSVKSGDIEEGINELAKLRPKAGAEYKKKIDLWTKQMKLELEKDTGDTLTNGDVVWSDVAEMGLSKEGFSSGALIIKARITNKGQAQLTLKNDHFYLRGLKDIVPVATSHTSNTLDGAIIPPGKTKEGIVVFRKIPTVGVVKSVGKSEQTYYFMFFNNGEIYIKQMLPF